MKNTQEDFAVLGEAVCEVCGIVHSHTNTILLSKTLRSIPKDKRIVGYELCEPCSKLNEDGYLALAVVHECSTRGKDKLKQEDADRTGDIMHIRRTMFHEMFDTNIPDTLAMVFISVELFNELSQLHAKTEEQ
jgi:hypothetical protein